MSPISLVDLGAISTFMFVFVWLMRRQQKRSGSPLSHLGYYPQGLPIIDEIEGFKVRIESHSVPRRVCHIEVGGPEELVVSETRAPRPDSVTGDPEFDALLSLNGNHAHIAAALDAATRAEVLSHFAKGVRLQDGYFVIELDDQGITAGTIRRKVNELLALARQFTWRESEELWTQLRKNAEEDPASGVRAWNLKHLAELAPNQESVPTLERALSDESASVRLLAASQLGLRSLPRETSERAFDALVRLLDAHVEADVRAGAARALGDGFQLDEIRPHLLPLLHDADDTTRSAAASALTSHGWNADAGGLALAEGRSESGALSLANEGGELTFADGDAIVNTRKP